LVLRTLTGGDEKKRKEKVNRELEKSLDSCCGAYAHTKISTRAEDWKKRRVVPGQIKNHELGFLGEGGRGNSQGPQGADVGFVLRKAGEEKAC